VRAVRVVDAILGDEETLHGLAAKEMPFHNFFHITELNAAIPDSAGVNHDTGPVLALIKTATAIRAAGRKQATVPKFLLEGRAEELPAFRITAPSGMSVWSLVATYEKMIREFRHNKGALVRPGGVRAEDRVVIPGSEVR